MSIAILLFGMWAGLTAASEAGSAGPKLTRVLVITGRDVAVHNWRETTPALREALEATKKFEVVVSEEPAVLESSAVGNYDVILLNYYNFDRPTLSANLIQAQRDYFGAHTYQRTDKPGVFHTEWLE